MNYTPLRGFLTESRWPSRLAPIALPAFLLLGCSDASGENGDGAGGSGGAPFATTSSGPGGMGPGPTSGPSSSSSSSSSSSATSGSGGGPIGGDTPVARHGRLKVMGNRVVDESGAQLQLKGMSLFWSVWEGEKFYNAAAVNTLVDDWKVSIIRVAMTVDPGEGYGYIPHPDAEKGKVRTIVDAAIARGIYVIIDWHDHDATRHTEQAKGFFREMAQQYGSQPNVIFEVFNEPDYESWGEVKSYAEQVIGEIRNAGSSNLVIVGSPHWSQDADVAAQDRITTYDNIAYTLHFYATSHRQSLRDKASAAMSSGLALFVTEWGTCAADGNGALDLGESQAWIDFMKNNGLSWLNWSVVDKAESCAALNVGASGNGPWGDAQLTQSGRWVKQKIQEP